KVVTTQSGATAAIWASRAALEHALGLRADAKTSLQRALAIDANNKNALLESGEIALAEGDNTGAMQTANKLQKIAPNALSVKMLIARALVANGKSAEALKFLEEIKNPPKDIIDLKNKIAATNAENAADLEKQLEKDGKNAAVLGRLCNLLRVENPPKALEYCKRAYDIESQNLNHAVGFGAALVQAKQYDAAVNLLRNILQYAPDNSTVRANLATALFQLKRYKEAIVEYNWLIEKTPDLAIAYYFLAISHDYLEKYLDAMANYQQFLKLADAEKNKLEIEKVKLRLPTLEKLLKSKK
ncbi:MAG TPA: tetratricopeptide repeat protein, partial [Pyrinomonadaceae bacterium]|nr:tetratricopeptide repeat protein [Pyrinomonadaceae bacterium]